MIKIFRSVIFCSSALKTIESGRFYTEASDGKNISLNSLTSLIWIKSDTKI